MSSTEWMIASQVTRSRCGSRTSVVSSVSAGSSSHASGSPSATRRYIAGSAGVSTTVPRYWPLKSTESTAPVAASSAMSSSVQSGVGVELEAQARIEREPALRTRAVEGGSPRPSRRRTRRAGSRPSASPSGAPS